MIYVKYYTKAITVVPYYTFTPMGLRVLIFRKHLWVVLILKQLSFKGDFRPHCSLFANSLSLAFVNHFICATLTALTEIRHENSHGLNKILVMHILKQDR